VIGKGLMILVSIYVGLEEMHCFNIKRWEKKVLRNFKEAYKVKGKISNEEACRLKRQSRFYMNEEDFMKLHGTDIITFYELQEEGLIVKSRDGYVWINYGN